MTIFSRIASGQSPLPRVRRASLSRQRERGRERAFTLLEMTLVLFILATVMGLFVSAAMTAMEDKKRDVTRQRMDEIERQLLRFRQINHRLPCPADSTLNIGNPNYGVEDRTGDCANSITAPAYPALPLPGSLDAGDVPTKALGLGDEFMYDGWDRRFRYVVVREFTLGPPSPPVVPPPCAFTTHTLDLMPVGGYPGLRIWDRNNNQSTDSALYALISFGHNGHGGVLQSGAPYSASSDNLHEQENCDCDAAAAPGAVDREIIEEYYVETTTLTNRYDDLVRYAKRENLLSQNEIDGFPDTCP